MNNSSVRLSDSKIIMTVQNILKEMLYPLSQGARTTQNRHVILRKSIWQGYAVLCGIFWRQC